MEEKRFPLRLTSLLAMAVVAVVFTVYGFFFAERHLKRVFERVATRLNRAEVTIGDLDLQLIRGKILLKDVEVTNYRNPLNNLAILRNVEVEFLPSQLLRRKFVVSDFKVEGIEYNTDRARSGKVHSYAASPGTTSVTQHVIPSLYKELRQQIDGSPLATLGTGLSTLDVSSAIKKLLARLPSSKTLTRLQSELNREKDKWVTLERKIPSRHDTRRLESELATIKKNTSARTDLKQRIEREYKRVFTTSEQMRQRLERLDGQLTGLTASLDPDTRLIKRALHLPDLNQEDLTVHLFGEKILNAVERLTHLITLSRRLMPPPTESKSKIRKVALDNFRTQYHFMDNGHYPMFYLTHGSLSSSGSSRHEVEVSGTLKAFSSEPGITKDVAKLNLEGRQKVGGIEGLKIAFESNHTSPLFHDSLRVDIERFPISKWLVKEGRDLQFGFEKATGALKIEAHFGKDQVDAKLEIDLEDAKPLIKSRNHRIVEAIQDAASNEFSLSGTLSGPYSGLDLKMESEFGKSLVTKLRKHYAHPLNVLEDNIKTQLKRRLHVRQNDLRRQFLRLKAHSLPVLGARLKELTALKKRIDAPA